MTQDNSTTQSSPIARLAHTISRAERFRGDANALDKGEQAALARLDPDAPRPHQIGALARALVLAEIEPDNWQAETWQRWALLAHGIALAGHDSSARLGTQLAAFGDKKRAVSESRVTKLLCAHGDAFRQQVPRLLRLMASRGLSPNWLELGALILAVDRDESSAEALRLRIAGNYYAAAPR